MKVRCEDCAEYTDFRCSLTYRYMNPKTRRYCLHFKARTQIALEPWQGHPGWPP